MFKQSNNYQKSSSAPFLLSPSKKIKKQVASFALVRQTSPQIQVIQNVQQEIKSEKVQKKVICIIPPNPVSLSQIDEDLSNNCPSISTTANEISCCQISHQNDENSETNNLKQEKRKYRKNPLRTYKNYDGKVFYCNKKDELGCKFQTLNRTSYYNHIKHAHQSDVEFKCEQCSYKSMNKRNLNQHIAYCHIDTVLECPLCNKQNLNKYSLKKHLKEVHCEKQFKCDQCKPGSERYFKSKSSLNKHISNVHSAENYVCEHCQYQTKCQQYLKEHIKNRHSNLQQQQLEVQQEQSQLKLQQDIYLQQQFNKEIDILRKLNNHENIVKFIDFIEQDKNSYLILEFCQDGDLKEYIHEKSYLDEQEAIQIITSLIQALQFLKNDNNVIHRDLKPANILKVGNIFKIADFGFSTLINNTIPNYMMQSVVGSPYYMSPQLLSNQNYSYKTDVWSIGIIFYEMLFGDLPWQANNQQQLLQKIMTEPVNCRRKNINLSKQSIDILKMTIQVKEERRASWDDLNNFLLQQNQQQFNVQTGISISAISSPKMTFQNNQNINIMKDISNSQNIQFQQQKINVSNNINKRRSSKRIFDTQGLQFLKKQNSIKEDDEENNCILNNIPRLQKARSNTIHTPSYPKTSLQQFKRQSTNLQNPMQQNQFFNSLEMRVEYQL